MRKEGIHFWDMDHTVVDNDCDVSWKEFLMEKGLAPREAKNQIKQFWEQYKQGRLDLDAFIKFQLKEFTLKSIPEIDSLASEHFEVRVKPTIYRQAISMIAEQRLRKKIVCLITATNRVIAQPLADFLEFEHLLATEPEIKNDGYNGRISGVYCGGKGKIQYMKDFCDRVDSSISESYYYGDSVADIPVMNVVGHPVAVNPMAELRTEAKTKGWLVYDFRN